MECWSRMPDFDDLDARIEALCARATSPHPDARLVVEIEDLLAEGYVCALRGDRLTRNLQLRFELFNVLNRFGELGMRWKS